MNGLDAFFEPRSVAIVGASDDPQSLNGRALAYLRGGFTGAIHPVHPQKSTVQGLPAVRKISELPTPPDLAIVVVRATSVLGVAEDAAAAGVKALLVFSSGFREVGPEGQAMETALVDLGRRSGLRIMGPNCVGLISLPVGNIATFAALDPPAYRAGRIGLITQSGAMGTHLFKSAQRAGIGISHFAATGNEADVSTTDLIEYLVERDDVDVVTAFAEHVAQPDRLFAVAAAARRRGKPLVFMKVGRSASGARAAVSHTGSMAGSDAVVEAAFRQHGIVRATTTGEFLSIARLLAQGRRPRGRRLGIVTVSGGGGVLAADEASEAGLEVPPLTGADRERVAARIPVFGSADNPVDCTAQIGVNDQTAVGAVLEAVSVASTVDMLCYSGLSDVPTTGWLDALRGVLDATDKPLAVVCATPGGAEGLTERGVPCFTDTREAMRALAALADVAEDPPVVTPPSVDPQGVREVLAGIGRSGALTEAESRAVLAGAGIGDPDGIVADSPAAAARAAAELGFPVALKIVSADVPHKSDAGGVVLHVATADEARSAYERIHRDVARHVPAARLDGVLVQRMAPAGTELMVGVHRDPTFGPVLTVGLGGVRAELIDRVERWVGPVDADAALGLLRRVCGGRLVGRPRGVDEAGARAVAALAARLSGLVAAVDEIAEVDLNPVIVHPDGAFLADALVVVAD